jgi:uncharacterized protein (TIGR02145 family)
VNPIPKITLASGTAIQYVNQNTAATTTIYTATNSAIISRSGSTFPNGLNGAANSSSYTISGTPSVTGAYGYSLTAAVGGCTSTAASGTITVTGQSQGRCTYTEPAVVGTFAAFNKNYSAATYVSLTDERDNKVYPVVKIGGRWIMARNLNYQTGLTWRANSTAPSTGSGQNTALIGNFWCPGGSSSTMSTSTRESCEVWGALYSWETAMMLDGYGTWTEVAIYNSDAANATNSQYNHGRIAHSGSTTGGRGICPPNWHVPTDNEWGIILDGMESGGNTTHQNASTTDWYGTDAGSRAKSKCIVADNNISGATYVSDTQTNWYYYSSALGTDVYGFRVLPAGSRILIGSNYNGRGTGAFFWSSTAYNDLGAWRRYFRYDLSTVSRASPNRSYGFSVRCIRD